MDGGVFDNASPAKKIADKLEDLSQHNTSRYIQALKALAPETAPVVSAHAEQLNQKLFNLAEVRLNPGRTTVPSRRGRAGGDMIGQTAGLWAQGLYAQNKLSSDNGFDGSVSGIAAGFDLPVSNHVRLGVGYAYTDANIDSESRETDMATHTALVYGQYAGTRAFVEGMAAYGRSAADEKKNIDGLPVSGDYDVDIVGARLTTGYRFKYVTPLAELRYTYTNRHAYRDTADQKTASADSQTLTGLIGFRAGAHTRLTGLKSVTFHPEISLAAAYDIVQKGDDTAVRVANGSTYLVENDQLERFGIEAGAQIGVTFARGATLSLAYEGAFRQDYTDHAGIVTLRFDF